MEEESEGAMRKLKVAGTGLIPARPLARRYAHTAHLPGLQRPFLRLGEFRMWLGMASEFWSTVMPGGHVRLHRGPISYGHGRAIQCPGSRTDSS
jgi:hypothetical protein